MTVYFYVAPALDDEDAFTHFPYGKATFEVAQIARDTNVFEHCGIVVVGDFVAIVCTVDVDYNEFGRVCVKEVLDGSEGVFEFNACGGCAMVAVDGAAN